MANRPVATIGPFPPPLQLADVSSRTKAGMFGPGWFCPQLESFVTPRGDDVYLWAKPNGGYAVVVVVIGILNQWMMVAPTEVKCAQSGAGDLKGLWLWVY